MMAVFLDLFWQLNKFFKKVIVSKSPENFVRLCRQRTEFITIVNEAIKSPDQNWDQELINRVVQCILEGGDSCISVYRSNTLDPFDQCHALAVIAEGISRDDFRSSKGSKRKTECIRGTLIIPTAYISKTTVHELTPNNNLDFYPADCYHFDLTINNAEELAITLLNGINRRIIAWSFLGNKEKFMGSYRLQAAIAYSYCLKIFGKLNPSTPPLDWANGNTITASEQIDTLKYLAQTVILDCPDLSP